jgi:hypothetical protein
LKKDGYPKNSKESYLSRSKTHICYKFPWARPSGETPRLLDIPISNKRWSMYISFRLMLMRKYFY